MDIDNLIHDTQEPRQHHYSFVYGVLPSLIFQQKEVFLPILASDDADELLKDIWHKVGAEFPKDQVMEPDGLKCSPFRLVADDLAASVISFPTPERPLEAIHALVLFCVSREQCRYITLEKSRRFLMISEQTANGTRKNLGEIGIKIAERGSLSADEFLSLVIDNLPSS